MKTTEHIRKHKHWHLALLSGLPAPLTGGDTASWFHYYKWSPDLHDDVDEVFIPVKIPFLNARPGDIVWISLDNYLLGGIIVERVLEDLVNQTQELWFTFGRRLLFSAGKKKKMKGTWGTKVPRVQGERWRTECKRPQSQPQTNEEDLDSTQPTLTATEAWGVSTLNTATEHLRVTHMTVNGAKRAVIVAVAKYKGRYVALPVVILCKESDQFADIHGNAAVSRVVSSSTMESDSTEDVVGPPTGGMIN